MELLEEDGAAALSLRAVARRAGVSPGAPYRHYADRDALISAVAAVGYRELAQHLAAAHPAPSTPDDLAAVAVAYVEFALDRPALFRVMFGEPCDRDSSERVAAVAAISEYLGAIVRQAFPGANQEAMSTAMWALVHGLAFLHLDGKFDASTPAVVSARVRAAVDAVIPASDATEWPQAARSSGQPAATDDACHVIGAGASRCGADPTDSPWRVIPPRITGYSSPSSCRSRQLEAAVARLASFAIGRICEQRAALLVHHGCSRAPGPVGTSTRSRS